MQIPETEIIVTKDDAEIFHFMLACYESQLGNLESAKASLARAFDLDEHLRLRARDEPELKQMWDSLRGIL
jgi:hypothetical protein